MDELTWKKVEEYIRDYNRYFRCSDPENKEVQILLYLLAEHLAEKEKTRPVERFRVSEHRVRKKVWGGAQCVTDEIIQAHLDRVNANSLKLRELGKNPESIGLLREEGYFKFTTLPVEDRELFEEEAMERGIPPGEAERLKAEVAAKEQVIAQLKGQINKFENRLSFLKSKSEFFRAQQARAGLSGSGEGTKEELFSSYQTEPLDRIVAEIESLKKTIRTKQNLILGLVLILYFIAGALWLKMRDPLNPVQGKIESLVQKVPQTEGFLELKEVRPGEQESRGEVVPLLPAVSSPEESSSDLKLSQIPPEQAEILPAEKTQMPIVLENQTLSDLIEKGTAPQEIQPSTFEGDKSSEIPGAPRPGSDSQIAPSPGVKSVASEGETDATHLRSPPRDECRSLWAAGLKARLSGEGRKALEILSNIPTLPCAKNKDIDGKPWGTKAENLTRIIKRELSGL